MSKSNIQTPDEKHDKSKQGVKHEAKDVSSRVGGDVILATYNSETFKFDFHEMHRLSMVNTRPALSILSNHLEFSEDASEYLSEDQIDCLKVPRGFPPHTEYLQTG